MSRGGAALICVSSAARDDRPIGMTNVSFGSARRRPWLVLTLLLAGIAAHRTFDVEQVSLNEKAHERRFCRAL